MQAKAKAMRAQGIDVISFGAGEPDFDTPQRIKDAAVRALESGQTKYTEVGGIPELRAAVCQKFKRDNGLDYASDEVTVSCGAKHTLYNIVMALVNPGDEVLIPSPFWVSYPEQVRLLGANPVSVPTQESSGFDLDPELLRRAVTPRTKIVILDSPGQSDRRGLLRPQALAEVAKLARRAESAGWCPTSATRRSPTRGVTCPSPRCRPRSRRARSWSTRAPRPTP